MGLQAMGDRGVIHVVRWAVDPSVHRYVYLWRLNLLPQLSPQGLHAGATIWNPLVGACVPAEPQAKYVVLLGTFSIYST